LDTPLDIDRVLEKLQMIKLTDWDQEKVADAVAEAMERFVDEDMRKYEIVAVEEYGEEPFRYRIDLVLREKTTGRVVIVDWKTRDGKLDDRWELRESRSHQPRLYAAVVAEEEVGYEVRGVSFESSIKVLRFPITRAEADEALSYLRSVEAQRTALVNIGKIPWTRNTQGCRAFGPMYPCEFEPFCFTRGAAVPEGQPVSALSYSTAGEFLRCPERYRLLQVLGKLEEDGEETTAKGTAFHAVMQDIYEQLRETQKRLTK